MLLKFNTFMPGTGAQFLFQTSSVLYTFYEEPCIHKQSNVVLPVVETLLVES